MSDDQFEAVVDDILLTHDLDGELRSLEDSLEIWKGGKEEEKPEEEIDDAEEKEERRRRRRRLQQQGKAKEVEEINNKEKPKMKKKKKKRKKSVEQAKTPTKKELSLALKLDKEQRPEKKYAKGNKISKSPLEETVSSSPATSARFLSPPSTASSAASSELLHTSRTERDRPRSGEMKQRAGWKRRRYV